MIKGKNLMSGSAWMRGIKNYLSDYRMLITWREDYGNFKSIILWKIGKNFKLNCRSLVEKLVIGCG